MLKKVKICTLFLPDELTMTIMEKDGKAFISKTVGGFSSNTETKQADIKVLRSLDIFFNSAELTPFNESDGKCPLTVAFDADDAVYTLDDNGTLRELEEYFVAYLDGTATPFSLTFHSFEGGGPEYSFENENTGILTWFSKRVYSNPDHEQLCGAGFDVIYDIYPLRAGRATAVIKGSSPICHEPDRRLFVSVGEDLSTEYRLEEITSDDDEI